MYSILILEKHIIVNINSFFRINQTSAFKTEKKKNHKVTEGGGGFMQLRSYYRG